MAENRMLARESTTLDDRAWWPRYPWLTPRRVLIGTLGWIGLYAIGSVALANPFFTERSAGASINYWNTMYLHGMLIGMVAVGVLLGMLVFEIRSRHAWLLIPAGVITATVFATVGGIFDRTEAPTEAGMWTQVVGFFALDEILAVAIVAFMIDWFARTQASRRLSFAVAWLSTMSMLIAAVMGHLAGWILSYGAHPWYIPGYARFIGEPVPALLSNLVGSHSHEMAVAFMAFIACAGVAQFAERSPVARGAMVRRAGLAVLGIGVVAFTAVYVIAGFTTWAIPTLFTSANGANGLAADDLVTGCALVGGLIALMGAAVPQIGRHRSMPAISAAWTALLSVGLVVATGYWIEFHETHFGAGDPKAAGAAADAVFTWFHQDIGLFLLPLMTAVMVLTARLVVRGRQNAVALAAIGGSSILFAAGMIYVFVTSAIHGPGFVVATIGLICTGGALVASMWWSHGRRMVAAHREHKPDQGRDQGQGQLPEHRPLATSTR
ncbi:MAG TPA: hypothetical protein VN840_00510 [Streptosporangiaceae bacterium]|nr:hypothetical protein [Streptosporangiaceae bacterium]